jgi:acetyltransferase-like isoleucine patch superfamily enzyme
MSNNFFRLHIFKTIFYNLKFFGFKRGLKFPILIARHTKIRRSSGKIIINSENISFGVFRIGFGRSGITDVKQKKTLIDLEGEIIIKGKASIGVSSAISVGKKGKLFLGDNFVISSDSNIICHKKIYFENNILISWGVLIMDTDFHPIYYDNKLINPDEEIYVHQDVWICCNVTILNNSKINSNIVIGANSLVKGHLNSSNSIYAGNPVKLIKNDIKWKK